MASTTQNVVGGIPLLGGVQNVGFAKAINSQAILVYELDAEGNVNAATGAVVVTDAGVGYAKGCIYTKTDASGNGTYLNIGTAASCDFDLIAVI